jgi:hypothetical protein
MLANKLHGLRKRMPQSSLLTAVLGSAMSNISNLGAKMPVSKVAETQMLPSKDPTPGAKRIKIRYGPVRLPGVGEKNFESQLLNQPGVANTLKFNAKKPCDGACLLLRLSAGIEYEDGSLADNANGAWFHHAVLMNAGPNVSEIICGGSRIERIFEAGNEKGDAVFTQPGSSIKTGYHMRPTDMYILNTEMMNMDNREKWLWLTITYDYLDLDYSEYKESKVLWLSIGPPRCGGSSDNPFGVSNLTVGQQPKALVLSEHSIPWTAPLDGWILATNGHMHDGGTATEVYKNNDNICTSIPIYSKTGGSGGMGGMPGGHQKRQNQPSGEHEMEHIASQTPCFFQKPIALKKNDIMYIKSYYDFTKHEG